MIHLDTNYLIGLPVKGSAAALEVDGWLAAGESLAASAIVWTEFLNGPVTLLEISRVEVVLESRMGSSSESVLVQRLSPLNLQKTFRRRRVMLPYRCPIPTQRMCWQLASRLPSVRLVWVFHQPPSQADWFD